MVLQLIIVNFYSNFFSWHYTIFKKIRKNSFIQTKHLAYFTQLFIWLFTCLNIYRKKISGTQLRKVLDCNEHLKNILTWFFWMQILIRLMNSWRKQLMLCLLNLNGFQYLGCIEKNSYLWEKFFLFLSWNKKDN